jgi:hypothetical protein
MFLGSIALLFAGILFFAGFLPSLAMAQQQQQTTTTTIGETGTTATTTSANTADQSATITGASTSPLTFTLRIGDEGAGVGEGNGTTTATTPGMTTPPPPPPPPTSGTTSPFSSPMQGGGSSGSAGPTTTTTSSATSTNLSTRNIGIEVTVVRGSEAPIILPINVTIPANVNNLELCASATVVGSADEMCQPVLRTIDLTQNGGAGAAATDTTASGTTTSPSPFSSPSSPPSSSSSAPTMTAPTTSFPPATTGGNSLIGVEDTTVNIPITVIAPITAEIQNAQLCAQLLSSGVQSCNQIILNPQQTSYTSVNVDMTTSPAPTVTSSQVTDTTTATGTTTGTTDTGGGAATSPSSSSSSTTTITTTPPTTTPGNNNNNTTDTTGGGAATFPSMPSTPSRDTTPPTLTVPNDMVLPTNGPTALLEYTVFAQDDRDGTAELDEDNQLIQGDNVGGNIFISCRPSSQYFLPPGNRTVECLAADAVNNTAEASFTVTVTGPATTTPAGTPSSGTITASLSANPATYNGPCPATIEFSGTITDNVGNRDVTYRFIRSDSGTGQEQVIHFNQPGSQSVSSSWIIGPDNPTEEYKDQQWVAIEILQPVQLQSNRAEFQITCPPSTGGGAPPPGGADTIAPSLSVPVDRVIPAITGTYIPYDVSATDNVDGTARLDANNKLTQDNVGGSVTIACDPPPSSLRPLGNHTIGCTATDAAGNRGTASFIVAVIKATANTPPVGSSSGSGGITVRAIGVTPSHYEGPPCPPPPYTFSGEITDSIGGRDITYRFAGTDGTTAPKTIHFDKPGTQQVSEAWQTLQDGSIGSYVVLEIISPIQLLSNTIEWGQNCPTPSTGAAQTLQAENATTTATTDEEDEEDTTATTDDGETTPPPPATTEGDDGDDGDDGETTPPPPATTEGDDGDDGETTPPPPATTEGDDGG